MGTVIKHPVPDRVNRSFAIFDTRALWRSAERAKGGSSSANTASVM